MKIAVVTGSRADKGPLTPVCEALGGIWVTVSPTACNSGYDAGREYVHCMNEALSKLQELKPDLVVLLGDRYEILAAATAAYMLQIPIAHLSGGDLTEGSQDNSMRHAITKLASLHFTTHKEATQRVLAMGEEWWRVHEVGCPGIDNLLNTELYDRETTRKLIGPPIQSVLDVPYYLVAYQPATLARDPEFEVDSLLKALQLLGRPVVFTTVNSDPGGIELQKKFEESINGVVKEMDSRLFLSAMKHCVAMIGNSSSGLYEAPSLDTPAVNIGMRQHGRPTAASVFSCPGTIAAIVGAAKMAACSDAENAVNPYGDGHAAGRIKRVIEHHGKMDKLTLLRKRWAQPWQTGKISTEKQSGGTTLQKTLLDLPLHLPEN